MYSLPWMCKQYSWLLPTHITLYLVHMTQEIYDIWAGPAWYTKKNPDVPPVPQASTQVVIKQAAVVASLLIQQDGSPGRLFTTHSMFLCLLVISISVPYASLPLDLFIIHFILTYDISLHRFIHLPLSLFLFPRDHRLMSSAVRRSQRIAKPQSLKE